MDSHVDPLVFVESDDAPELRDAPIPAPVKGAGLVWADVRGWLVSEQPARGFVKHRQVIPPRMRADRTYSVAAGPFVVVAMMTPVLMVGWVTWLFAG